MYGREQDSDIIRIRTRDAPAPQPAAGRSADWHAIGETRRRKGLSLEEVANRARVSPLVVEAIEAGAIERLPVGNGGRRETIAVCRALDLDPKPFLLDLHQRRPALAGQLESPSTVGRRTRFLIIGLVWVVLGAVLVLARSLGWLESTDEPAATATTAAVSSTLATTPAPPGPVVAYSVEVRATRGGTPLKVTVDGALVYDDILALDQDVRFDGNEVRLDIIQPTMVRVFVNGTAVASQAQMVFAAPPPAAPPADSAPPPAAPAGEGPAPESGEAPPV